MGQDTLRTQQYTRRARYVPDFLSLIDRTGGRVYPWPRRVWVSHRATMGTRVRPCTVGDIGVSGFSGQDVFFGAEDVVLDGDVAAEGRAVGELVGGDHCQIAGAGPVRGLVFAQRVIRRDEVIGKLFAFGRGPAGVFV